MILFVPCLKVTIYVIRMRVFALNTRLQVINVFVTTVEGVVGFSGAAVVICDDLVISSDGKVW